MNAVLDFHGHFLSIGWDSFFKRGVFQQPRLVSSTTVLEDYERALGWYGKTFNESEMARSSECTD
jgi:hypothetical protein